MPFDRSQVRELSPLEELHTRREALIKGLGQGGDAASFMEAYGEAADNYFRRSLQESRAGPHLFRQKHPFALVALGGYGRHELCVHSDLDIMILFGERIPPEARELSREVFLPLWDLGLDLGSGIRTLKDCLDLAQRDPEMLTAFLGARFLCGDSPLFLSLADSLHETLTADRRAAFGRWLSEQAAARMERFGDASHQLEPNLKEGIGGLRDYHQILWLASVLFRLRAPRDLEYLGVLSHHEFQGLCEDLDFIWGARNHLHHMCGRKNDRLTFAHQETIASRLGYRDGSGELAVERFMGRLHNAMAGVKSLHRSFLTTHLPAVRGRKRLPQARPLTPGLHLHQQQVGFDAPTGILADPLVLMRAFVACAESGWRLSMESRRLVREFLHLVDDRYRICREASRGFLKILRGPWAFEALEQMYETGFLEAYVPEFSRIRDRVQFDAYHLYPVGRHALQSLRHLKRLKDHPEVLLTTIFADLTNPTTLLLAALFHDIGKSGPEHARRGVGLTGNILKRLGYPEKERRDVLFLVRHHLLLARTATRRDLQDEKAVVQCARTVGNPERLKMLYLLTWADAMATGPRAWNAWIATLVQELFFKLLHMLERGELATRDAARRVRETRAAVLSLLGSASGGEEDAKAVFDVLPPRYLLNTRPGEIVRHLTLARRLGKHSLTPFVLQSREQPAEGCYELTFIARDRRGLFSDLAGVLALHSLNVLAAQIYTWRDGTAVDIFQVTRPLDPLAPQRIWYRVHQDLVRVFQGTLPLQARLAEKAGPCILPTSPRPRLSPSVRVDNHSSDFFTLIEILADDHVGRLYGITHTLTRLGLDIHIAKIATHGDQIADVFYVRDAFGQKVRDEGAVRAIRDSLLQTLT